MAGSSPILLYDGVCGLCNGAVQFVLRHDPAGRFRFAPLQSDFARGVLTRHGHDPDELNTVFLVLDPGTPQERLLARSDAALAVLRGLGGRWAVLGAARGLPRAVRDRVYDFIARHRYGWFGRYDHCPLPTPEARARFVIDASPSRVGA